MSGCLLCAGLLVCWHAHCNLHVHTSLSLLKLLVYVAPPSPSSQAMPADPAGQAAFISDRIASAAQTGILDLRGCGTPAAVEASKALSVVYVADVRGNGWASVPPGVLALEGLVVLNASHNDIKVVADGGWQGVCAAFHACPACPASRPVLHGALRLLEQIQQAGSRSHGRSPSACVHVIECVRATVCAQASCQPAWVCSTCRSTRCRSCPPRWARPPCCSRCTWPTTSGWACDTLYTPA